VRPPPAGRGALAVPLHLHLGDVAWKTVFFYLLLVALLRLTGKRELGSLSAIDLVGLILVSEAAIISVADSQIPFPVGVTPVLLLGGLMWLLSFLSLKSHAVRALVEGQPTVVVAHGRLNEDALRHLRYNIGDLLAEVRAKNLSGLADVEFAVLEATGKLSVIPRAGARPATPDDLARLKVAQVDPVQALPAPDLPATVVVDGQVDEDALRRAGRNRVWLEEELRRQGLPAPTGILVATLAADGTLTAQPARGRGAETRATEEGKA
jgi:uncharacterized membrane protein YcaP (DUF421 family)